MRLSPTMTEMDAWIFTSACTCYYLGLDQYHYPVPYYRRAQWTAKLAAAQRGKLDVCGEHREGRPECGQ